MNQKQKISQQWIEKHGDEIRKMRKKEKKDLENAKNDLCLIFSLDMPCTNTTSSYSKMNLQMYNFTPIPRFVALLSTNFRFAALDFLGGVVLGSYFPSSSD